MNRTMRVTVDVTVYNAPDENATTEELHEMEDRVISAMLPHPDSRIATDRAGESITVLASSWGTVE